MDAILLETPPRLSLVAAPLLPPEVAAVVAEERERLESSADHFNGPQLLALSASAAEVVCYHGSYAHFRAWQRLGSGALGIGSVGIGLLLYRGVEELWVRRSAKVDQPLSWCFAVAGGVTSARAGYRGTVLAEAKEELGLSADQLSQLRPLALLPDYGAYLVFRAEIAPEATLVLNHEETIEARLVNDWRQLAPIDPHIITIRSQLTGSGLAL